MHRIINREGIAEKVSQIFQINRARGLAIAWMSCHRAFLLIRPLEVMEKAKHVSEGFTDAAVNEVEQWAKPFALVAPEFAAPPEVWPGSSGTPSPWWRRWCGPSSPSRTVPPPGQPLERVAASPKRRFPEMASLLREAAEEVLVYMDFLPGYVVRHPIP
jgi:hypothetical protein